MTTLNEANEALRKNDAKPCPSTYPSVYTVEHDTGIASKALRPMNHSTCLMESVHGKDPPGIHVLLHSVTASVQLHRGIRVSRHHDPKSRWEIMSGMYRYTRFEPSRNGSLIGGILNPSTVSGIKELFYCDLKCCGGELRCFSRVRLYCRSSGSDKVPFVAPTKSKSTEASRLIFHLACAYAHEVMGREVISRRVVRRNRREDVSFRSAPLHLCPPATD